MGGLQFRESGPQNAVDSKVYTACNTAAQAVSVALATTYTGLCLSNPVGNQNNLVLLAASYALAATPVAAAPVFLLSGYHATTNVTHTTPSTGVVNSFLGAGTVSPTAKVDSAATLPAAPKYLFPLFGSLSSGDVPTTPEAAFVRCDGLWIIPPGAYVAFGALTAVSGFGAFVWQEVGIQP
jgi:hypothetical protein